MSHQTRKHNPDRSGPWMPAILFSLGKGKIWNPEGQLMWVMIRAQIKEMMRNK